MVPPSFDIPVRVAESAGDQPGELVIRDLFFALLSYF